MQDLDTRPSIQACWKGAGRGGGMPLQILAPPLLSMENGTLTCSLSCPGQDVAELATCQDRRANRSMHHFPWTQCGKNVLNFQALLLRIAIQNTITKRFNLIVTWLEMTSLCQ